MWTGVQTCEKEDGDLGVTAAQPRRAQAELTWGRGRGSPSFPLGLFPRDREQGGGWEGARLASETRAPSQVGDVPLRARTSLPRK